MMQIEFPDYSGVRCLMMPYFQGDPSSVPHAYHGYKEILRSCFIKKGDIGFLTIDESWMEEGVPHRGARAKYGRALHTEAGRIPGHCYKWGGGGWGTQHHVELERSVQILIASNLSDTCAVWDAEHDQTSDDGDIGDHASQYPYPLARMLHAGEVAQIGILTPHESLPARKAGPRQFLRIISSGVHGREPYFTRNPFLGG